MQSQQLSQWSLGSGRHQMNDKFWIRAKGSRKEVPDISDLISSEAAKCTAGSVYSGHDGSRVSCGPKEATIGHCSFSKGYIFTRQCFHTALARFRRLQLQSQRSSDSYSLCADLPYLRWSIRFCKDLARGSQSIGSWNVVQQFHSTIFLCSNEWKTILSIGVNRCWSALSTRMLHAFLKNEHGWHTLH